METTKLTGRKAKHFSSESKWKRYRGKRNRRQGEQQFAFILRIKNQPCTDCGKQLAPNLMHFDHVPERGPKLFEISFVARRRHVALDRLLAEIAKCDLVCNRCHGKRGATRREGK